MRVIAVTSFAGVVANRPVSYAAGNEFDLPDGVDWLNAGLVKPTGKGQERETAVSVPISTISGIGPKTVQALAKVGVNSLADLVAADPDELDKALEVAAGAERIQEWQAAARLLVSEDASDEEE